VTTLAAIVVLIVITALLVHSLLTNSMEGCPFGAHGARLAALGDVPVSLVPLCQGIVKAGGNLTMDGNTGRTAAVVPYVDEARIVLSKFRAFIENTKAEPTASKGPF
jgi:hypothetical protein